MENFDRQFSDQLEGNFDRLVSLCLEGKDEVVKINQNQFIRVVILNTPQVKPILDILGIDSNVTVKEHIKLSRDSIEITVQSPDAFNNRIEFVETRKFTRKGCDIEYLIHTKGCNKMFPIVLTLMDQLYFNPRKSEIIDMINSTRQDYDIPQ